MATSAPAAAPLLGLIPAPVRLHPGALSARFGHGDEKARLAYSSGFPALKVN